MIMIDQDTTMRKTIQEFILGTVHRNPFWHIMRNAREHLGTLIMTREGLSHQVDFVAVAQGIDRNFDTNLEIVHKYSFLLSKL